MPKKFILRTFQFRSKSSASIIYSVLLYSDGSASCNCKGWCRHAQPDGTRSCCHVTDPQVLAVLRPHTGQVAPTGHAMVAKREIPAQYKHGSPGVLSSRPIRRFQFED